MTRIRKLLHLIQKRTKRSKVKTLSEVLLNSLLSRHPLIAILTRDVAFAYTSARSTGFYIIRLCISISSSTSKIWSLASFLAPQWVVIERTVTNFLDTQLN